MKPWYRNSTLQMDDGEMEWLQSKEPASCAIWEWMKADSMKRDTDELRSLSPQEMECVCRKLGVSLPTFSQVSQNLQTVGWVANGRIRGWKKWNDRSRTSEEDALRKQVEYWKQKANSKPVTETGKKSPRFLPNSPKPPQLEETRGEESTNSVGGDSSVELPYGFPATVDDAITHAAFVGCDAIFASKVWNKAAGRGGRDNREVSIRSWRHHLATEWSYEQERRTKEKLGQGNGNSRKPFISELESQMKAKQRLVDTHCGNPQSISYRKNCTELEKSSLRQLRKDISELNNQIANGGKRA